MTPADLEGAGRTLFGEGWKRPLAALVGVNERSVHRWARGENPIPSGLGDEIITAIAQKSAENIEVVIRAAGPPAAITLSVYPDDQTITELTGEGWTAAFHRRVTDAVAAELERKKIKTRIVLIERDPLFIWLKKTGQKNSPATRAAFAVTIS